MKSERKLRKELKMAKMREAEVKKANIELEAYTAVLESKVLPQDLESIKTSVKPSN